MRRNQVYGLLAGLLSVVCLSGARACGDREDTFPAVDENLLTREEALARFRHNLEPVAELSGGAPSRDSLVARFVAALEGRDTVALQRMAITTEEYAFLYYPDNPQSLPPYDLRPALMWQMLRHGSERGLVRLLEERAGFPLGVRGYRCDEVASPQGGNIVVGPCFLARRGPGGGESEERLFGLIIERGGQFKFVSYANPLD